MIFGKKAPDARTYLLLDVENGSVGGALVRLQEDTAPKLFAERREHLPVRPTRSAADIFVGVKNASRKVLAALSEVAARLRQHPKTASVGEVEHAAIFLSAPWGSPHLASGQPRFSVAAQEMLVDELKGFFDIPSSFYTSAGALYRGSRQIVPYERDYLLVGVGGETSELLAVRDGAVAGYATFPAGSHHVLRTLRTHADMTPQEARHLLAQADALARQDYREALGASGDHFANSFAAAAEPLLVHGTPNHVFTASRTGGDLFARSLSSHALVDALFPIGGVVRAIRPLHATPHLSAHAEHPDLWLMLEALFATAL